MIQYKRLVQKTEGLMSHQWRGISSLFRTLQLVA